MVLFVSIFLSGLITEAFVWNFLMPPGKDPGVSQNILLHLGQFSAFYAIVAGIWTLVILKKRPRIKTIFLIQAIFGILIEQQGRFLLNTISNPLVIFWWPVVIFVYTVYVVGPVYILRKRLLLK